MLLQGPGKSSGGPKTWITAGTEGMGDKEASVVCGTREEKETSSHDPKGEPSQLSIIPRRFCFLQS